MEEEPVIVRADEQIAFYGEESVNIHGGYKSATRGYCVEITNNNGGFVINNQKSPRISVPFEELVYGSMPVAEEIFEKCFKHLKRRRGGKKKHGSKVAAD